MKSFFLSSVLFLCTLLTFSQEKSALTVPDTLKAYANSVIRNENTLITIDDIDDMTVNFSTTITVYNELGLKQVGAYVNYDDVSKVKDLDFYVYNLVGEEVEHFRKRDFVDQSAVSGGTLYSDSRVYYLDYKPRTYPLTVKFEYELNTANTAFIRPYYPIDRYFQSVEQSSFKIVNNTGIKLREKPINFEEYSVQKVGSFHYEAKEVKALKREEFSPSLQNFVPSVRFALNEFHLEGVNGKANNWKEFGQWQYDNFIKFNGELPAELITEVKRLVANVTTTREKAELIYEFMQDNSRYISVQLGIGGWEPMAAEEVYDKKYGDCKALTNYTMVLLKTVGIDSRYCVVYSGSDQQNVDADFFSMQGDHVILNVKDKNDSYWLECTSQTQAFDFLGTFTDDRNVLAIDESGGEIIKTPQYINATNLQESTANLSFENLDLNAKIKIESFGTQYDNKAGIERQDDRTIRRFYQNYWDYINRLNIKNYTIQNSKKNIQLSENVELTANNYLQKFGNDIILEVNPFNRNQISAKSYEQRQTPFQINRGFKDVDHFIFDLGNYQLNNLPKNLLLDSKFGHYELSFQYDQNNQLIVKRQFELFKNDYDKSEYDDFLAFLNQVTNNDQTKIILN